MCFLLYLGIFILMWITMIRWSQKAWTLTLCFVYSNVWIYYWKKWIITKYSCYNCIIKGILNSQAANGSFIWHWNNIPTNLTPRSSSKGHKNWLYLVSVAEGLSFLRANIKCNYIKSILGTSKSRRRFDQQLKF